MKHGSRNLAGVGVVVTGLGMVTPLGTTPEEVLRRIESREVVAAPPRGFDAGPFACPVCAEIPGFEVEQYVRESKALRLMNRDSLLAVAAARLAVRDAGITVGMDYAPEDIALFGATGMSGLPLSEVAPLIRYSAGSDGRFSEGRFGEVALRRVRPILSFKILSNMPVCFVSIFERIQGINAVYNPWEGQGAQAIVAGIRAIQRGDALCALVGGCDVKTHELAFIGLEQQGVFRSWREPRTNSLVRGEEGNGCVPGEGAAFLFLEGEERAASRGARVHARLVDYSIRTTASGRDRSEMLSRLATPLPDAVVAAADGDATLGSEEDQALMRLGVRESVLLRPKIHLGNLFAAAAAVQVALAATLAKRHKRILANCFGHGSEQGAFLLEGV
jgi:3-oxoacyl-[acyl-carrier-protein] synthase II